MSLIYPICVDDKTTLYLPKIYRDGDNDKFKCKTGLISFYAIVPNMVPIPTNMSVVCVEIDNENNIKNVKYVKDPNVNTLKDCISFITYTKPVPFTSPLYFYKREDKIYPTFEKEDINYLLRIFVMLKPYDFICYQNRCIPTDKNGMNIMDCTILCNKEPSRYIFYYLDTHKEKMMILLAILLIFIYIGVILFRSSKNHYLSRPI